MAKTESLMGSGKLYPNGADVAKGRGGVEVKYQLQVTSAQNGEAEEWQGFIRMPSTEVLPGTNSPNPKRGTNFLLVLADNDDRTGRIQIDQLIAQVGGFYNYSVHSVSL